MALYRLSVRVISRGNTSRLTARNAVAAAAYVARDALYDEEAEQTHNYEHRHADLEHEEVLLPERAPPRWKEREVLWNEVHRRERHVRAQLARSVVLTLPRELPIAENVELARDFFSRAFVGAGMVADMAVHLKPGRDGAPQPHAHALLTTRRIDGDRFGLKERAWNAVEQLQSWRRSWAEMANERLAAHGVRERVDHRRRAIIAGLTRMVAPAQELREQARMRPVREMARVIVQRVSDWGNRGREPVSERDAVDAFRAALHEHGLRPNGDVEMDGRWHRVPVEGDRKGQRSGSYLGHLDGRPNGLITNFKVSDKPQRWTADGVYVVPDPARLDAERAARRVEREQAQEAAANRARRDWLHAVPARDHPYLRAKEVSGDGLRVTQRGDLLVPLRDAEGRLHGVQTITPDGEKLFGRGQRITGTHVLLGELRPHEPLIVAEGYATAATIHAATGRTVVAAMNAGNLEAVARAYRERDPNRVIVIAADNDHHLPLREPPAVNVGLQKAQEAAVAVSGTVVAPAFALGDKGTDWNDYARMHGNDAVRRAFERVGMPVSDPMERQAAIVQREITQAERDRARQAVPTLSQAVVSADVQAQQAARRAQDAAARSHELTL